MKITICASAKFAKEMIEVKKILEERGHKILLPEMAESFAKRRNKSNGTHYFKWRFK